MEFSPIGTHRNATASQTQDAWVKVHNALRYSSYAMFAQSILLSMSAYWIHEQMAINEVRQKLVQSIFLSLCIGAILFGILSMLINRTYPHPNTFPPHAAIRRLQVGRMLMLLFGAGYIVRGIDLLKKSGKAARKAGAYDIDKDNQEFEHGVNVVDEIVDEITKVGMTTTHSIMESVMLYGATEACLVCLIGAIGVMSSYWIGKQLKNLRSAMKFTKSFKSS